MRARGGVATGKQAQPSQIRPVAGIVLVILPFIQITNGIATLVSDARRELCDAIVPLLSSAMRLGVRQSLAFEGCASARFSVVWPRSRTCGGKAMDSQAPDPTEDMLIYDI